MLLELASVTDSLVTFATHVIRDLGLGGVLLMTTTTGVIGLPGTEPTMLFAGFNVYQGHLTLLGIVIFGLIGDTLGACIAYAIGYFGRAEWLSRSAGKLHVSHRRIEIAERWFARWGAPAIFFSRMIPVVRAAFPYAAGVARMPFIRFVILCVLGSIPWILGLAVLGQAVGSSWQSWRHYLEYVDYVGAVVLVALLAYLLLRRTGGGGGGPAPDVAS